MATFGYTTVGATQDYRAANIFVAMSGTSPEAGTADSITAYIDDGGGGGHHFKGVLSPASSLTILTNGVGSGTTMPTSPAWTTDSFATGPSITAIEYAIGVIADYGRYVNYDTTGSYWIDASNSYATPTDPTDATHYTTKSQSIYVNYTAGGATTYTKTTSLNAVVKKQGILKTASLNAVLVQTFTKTANLNSVLSKLGITVSADVNAVLHKAGITKISDINAVIQKALTKTASLDTVLTLQSLLTAAVNAIIHKANITVKSTVDYIIYGTPTTTFTGGFWYAYEKEVLRRKQEQRKRDELEEKARQLQDKLDREIALEYRKREAEQARIDELKRLTRLAEQFQETIQKELSDKVIIAAERAIKQGNYSAMEALNREIDRAKEEEMFLIDAAMLILND